MGQFNVEQKNRDIYLDFAANGSGADKSEMTAGVLRTMFEAGLRGQTADMRKNDWRQNYMALATS